ncbi:MAG: LA_2272 family surface repeat-containing protein [Kiritimatiellia bacterium]
MKKILMALCVAWACTAAFGQETSPVASPASSAKSSTKAAWPVWLAFNSTKNIDVVGLRLTLPYGKCESVTGFDLGVYGSCRYFEGLQVNILRNEAEDIMAGIQLGVYNSAGRADLTGVQVGLFNEARSLRGIQFGLINIAEQVQGFQVGLVNRAETAYGFQVGGVNVIRDSELAFCPIVNIGFDIFPNY